MNGKFNQVTRGFITWSEALAQSMPDGRSATPTAKVQGAPPSPISGSYERLIAGLKRQATEVQQKIIGLPPAAGHPQEEDLRAELASLMKKLDSLPADLDSLRSATDRLTRQYFLLGLACAVPVGLVGSFLAYLLGWS